MMFALSDNLSPAPSFPAPWHGPIRLLFARAARALRMVAVAGGAIAAAGVSEPEAATFDLILNSGGVPLTQGTFEVPDALLGPANANGFIRFSQFIKFDITINESRFDLPGDIIYDPGDGLLLDASGQPLAFRNINFFSAYLIDDDRTAPLGGQNYLHFIVDSYPRWFMRDYWTGGSWGGDAYYIRKPVPPRPKLYLAGKEEEVTDTTQKVVIGQRIALEAHAVAGTVASQLWQAQNGGFAAIGTEKWIGQGAPISKFDVTTTSGSAKPVPANATSSLTFYWTLPGRYAINYKYTLSDSAKGTLTVTFDVEGPDHNVAVKTGRIAVLDNRKGRYDEFGEYGRFRYLSCGEIDGVFYLTDITDCIRFNGTASRTKSGQSGSLSWAQTIIRYYKIYNQRQTCGQIDGETLDERYPYGGVPVRSWMKDSPATRLYDSDTRMQVRFRARMHMMWRANLEESIRVPLGYVEWSWYGEAGRPNTGSAWRVVSPNPKPYFDLYVRSNRYPTWTKIFDTKPCK